MESLEVANEKKPLLRLVSSSICEDIITSSQLVSSALVPMLKADVEEADLSIVNNTSIKLESHDDDDVNSIVMKSEGPDIVPLKNPLVRLVKLEYQAKKNNKITPYPKVECKTENNSGNDDYDSISDDMDGSFDGNSIQETILQVPYRGFLNTMEKEPVITIKQEIVGDINIIGDAPVLSKIQDEMELLEVANEKKLLLRLVSSSIFEESITSSQLVSSALVPTLKAEIEEGDINIVSSTSIKLESLADDINSIVMKSEGSDNGPLKNLILRDVKLEYQGDNSNEITIKEEYRTNDSLGDNDNASISNNMDGSFDGSSMQETIVQDNLHLAIPPFFKTANRSSTRKRMMKKMYLRNQQCYKCTFCSYECCHLSHLTKHLRVHTGEKPYKCNFCSYECSDHSNLKNHLRIHTGEKPYKCNSCTYECSKHSNLKNHLRIHTAEKPYKCNSCSYECSQLSNLKSHYLRIHSSKKPYKCNSCSYECSTASSLKIHLRIHNGEKPYKCNTCSYECSNRSSLKSHLRIHTGEKPYKCNACSYECSTASSLKIHLRIHNGEKPYKCNTCSYECSHRSSLKNHLRIHTGEKPYKCNACSYECSNISSLHRHLRIHSGKKPYKCNCCSYECSDRSNLKIHLRIHTSKIS